MWMLLESRENTAKQMFKCSLAVERSQLEALQLLCSDPGHGPRQGANCFVLL